MKGGIRVDLEFECLKGDCILQLRRKAAIPSFGELGDHAVKPIGGGESIDFGRGEKVDVSITGVEEAES